MATKPTTTRPRAKGSEYAGCWVVSIVLGLLLLLALCSKPATQPQAPPVQENNVAAAVTPPAAPTPPQPLDHIAVARGLRHATIVYKIEGAVGAEIYSRNCYDALAHHFDWARLDICGAFDMAALQRVASDPASIGDQQTYFGPETAAGRYLAAATKAGEPADEADQRLALLQRRTTRFAAPASEAQSVGADLANPVAPNQQTGVTANSTGN